MIRRWTVVLVAVGVLCWWGISTGTGALASPVPDTGQTRCYDEAGVEMASCPQPGEPLYGQDGCYTINPPDFTKLDGDAAPLSPSASSWAMVRDNVTGLVWEVKTVDGTVHDRGDQYDWYDARDDFIPTLNAGGAPFGGYTDWRLPTYLELLGIVDYSQGAPGPCIDPAFFLNTVADGYWTATSQAQYGDEAWLIDFEVGEETADIKTGIHHVRAVRGGGDSPADHWSDNGDGTATDTRTGLLWARGSSGPMTWAAALAHCEALDLAGYDDWRLPTARELASLIDPARHEPAIDSTVFPDTHYAEPDAYVSSTSVVGGSHDAWAAYFNCGGISQYYKSYGFYVRAVRGGQDQEPGHPAIQAPAMASVWPVGAAVSIEWDPAQLPGDVALYLSREGGRTGSFTTTITDGTPNDGGFDWTVTGPGSVNGVLKLVPLSDPTRATTQGMLVIEAPPPSTFSIEPSSLSVGEPDGTASVTVRLNRAPSADVVLPLYRSPPGPCELSATSVTLTDLNWSTGVTVEVSAVDDDLHTGDQSVEIRTGPAESGDPGFNGLDPVDVTVTVQDDDPETLIITSVHPNTGVLGESLPVVLFGAAFDADTIVTVSGPGYPATVYSSDQITVQPGGRSLSLTLASPPLAGDFDLKVARPPDEEYLLPGAVSFQGGGVLDELTRKKAVIVAGGGPFPGNDLWPGTQTCADTAYHALTSQGYSADQIHYLTAAPFVDVDGDGNNDRDDGATLQTVEDALTGWAAADDPEELLLYLTDHGGDGVFRISETEWLSAGTLDGWLDALQTGRTVRVMVIYDACQAGSFLAALQAPSGAERYVVASTAPDAEAWFSDAGRTSFSAGFWRSVYLSGKLFRAFEDAQDAIEVFYQVPGIDLDGDGTADTVTSAHLANDPVIGLGKVAASVLPEIGGTCGSLVVDCGNTGELWVEDLDSPNGLAGVWARVIPPVDPLADPSQPALNLHSVRLSDDGTGRYIGTFSDFRDNGNYTVIFYAEDKRGNRSRPARATVFRDCEITTVAGDLDADEAVTLADGLIALQTLSSMAPRDLRGNYPAAGVDVTGNTTVDLGEAIYVFQKVAGLRD